MTVKRWVIKDPTNTDSYTFPRNPVSMTSVYADLAISSLPTMRGKRLFWQGATPAKEWSFTGIILDKSNLTEMHRWCLTKERRLVVVDHYGRIITCVFTKFDAVPKRRRNVYWSHDYTATAQIVSVVAANITVPNTGPE